MNNTTSFKTTPSSLSGVRLIICLSLLVLFNLSPISAQQIRRNDLTFYNVSIQRVGGNIFTGGDVIVSFDMEASKKVRRSSILTIVPTLVGKSQDLELPPIEVSYKKARINRWRRGEVTPIVDIMTKPGEMISYATKFKYSDWMNGASLKINSIKCVCANLHSHQSYFISPCITLAKKYKEPTLRYITPPKPKSKSRAEQGKAYIEFRVGRWEILNNFANNWAELHKIDTTIEKILAKKSIYNITNISLTGGCSPEGGEAMNTRLAQNRVESLESYLVSKYRFPSSLIQANSIGEDWRGLAREIKRSNLPNRGEILDIINSKESDRVKDQRMARLYNYSTILREYYPRLRSVAYRIEYTIKDFDLAQSKEMVKKSPKDMSEKELYDLAMSYKAGSKQFSEMINLSALLYPDSATALLNAAVLATKQGKYGQAAKYLEQAQPLIKRVSGKQRDKLEASIYNILGAIKYKKMNISKARALFAKGMALGSRSAAANLKYLKTTN